MTVTLSQFPSMWAGWLWFSDVALVVWLCRFFRTRLWLSGFCVLGRPSSFVVAWMSCALVVLLCVSKGDNAVVVRRGVFGAGDFLLALC